MDRGVRRAYTLRDPMDRAASNDAELLAAARAGDRAALVRLLERHEDAIYRFALRMCRDREDARDIVQETLLAAVRGLGEFRGEAALSTWLFAVARSFCGKKRRLRKGEPHRLSALDEAPEVDALVDAGHAPDEVLVRRELERAIAAAIDALDPRAREVLLLRDVEGLAAAEVAAVVGVGIPAVKSRLHRARLAVRERIAPLLEARPAHGTPAPPAPVRAATAVVPNRGSEAACPDVLALLSRHLEGQVRPSVCRELEGHVEQCSRCRAACDSLRRTLALCKTHVRDDEVPPAVRRAVHRALLDDLASIS